MLSSLLTFINKSECFREGHAGPEVKSSPGPLHHHNRQREVLSKCVMDLYLY